MLSIKLYDPTYSVHYYLVTGCTTEQFYEYIEKETCIKQEIAENVNPWNALFEGIEINGECHCFLYLSDKYNEVSSLTHELIHAIIYVFDIRGIPINRENDEAFAWYFDSIFSKLLKKTNEKQLQKSKLRGSQKSKKTVDKKPS